MSAGVVADQAGVYVDGKIAWSESLGETIRGIGTSSEGLYVGTLKGLVFARPWPPAEN